MTGVDVTGRFQGYTSAKNLIPGVYEGLSQQLGAYLKALPASLQSTSQALSMLANPDAMAQSFTGQAQAAGGSQLQATLQRLNSMGGSAGAKAGAAINSQNQIAGASNAFRANQDSAQGRLQRAGAINSLVNSLNPQYGGLEGLAGIETGTPRNQSGLQAITSVLGNISGTIPMKGGGSVTV